MSFLSILGSPCGPAGRCHGNLSPSLLRSPRTSLLGDPDVALCLFHLSWSLFPRPLRLPWSLSLSHLRLPVWLSASLLFSSPVSCPPSFLPRPQHGGSLEDSLWLCRAQQCRLQPQSSGSWLCSNWQSSSEVLSSLCAWSSIRGPLPSF